MAGAHFSAAALIASKKGRVVVAAYNATGVPYAYYGNGMFVLVDTLRPGWLDVVRGVSPQLFFGSVKPSGSGPSHYNALRLGALAGNAGVVAFDFSKPLAAAFKLARHVAYSRAERTLTFIHRGTGTVILSPRGSAFPIRAWAMPKTKGMSVSYYDIARGSQPLERLFGVTLSKLRALGIPLSVWNYRPGMVFRWFPPPDFGSKPGELRAAAALEKLMPVSRRRLVGHQRRQLMAQLSRIAAGVPAGTKALMHVYATMEWGSETAVANYASRPSSVVPHRGYDFNWDFSRAKYHAVLVRAWGRRVMHRLMRAVEALALGKKSTPTQRVTAVDLLSDIGPSRSCSDWIKDDGPLAKALASANSDRRANAVLLDLLRVRWGAPLGPGGLPMLLKGLAERRGSLFFRVRILEMLCFTRALPYDPGLIVPLVKESLIHPVACLSGASPERFLYDLSLCRNGRKILLQQWADPNSVLAANPLLHLAAFNRLWPGSPGYNQAIEAAARVFGNPACSRAMQEGSLSAICRAPRAVYRPIFKGQLRPGAPYLRPVLRAIAAKKDAAFFMPQLIGIFPGISSQEKILDVGWAVEFGFPKGGDADCAVPLILVALHNPRPSVVSAAFRCIAMLHYMRAKLDFSRLYPGILGVLRGGGERHLKEGADALYCFGIATNGRWSPPSEGLWPPEEGGANTSPAGLAWWRTHYAAVRRSALRWAAAHPEYPTVNKKKR
jgi:hypothetical protein